MTLLPKSLEKEPLVEAVFEVRLNDTPQLADILPGFLLHDLGPETKVQRLPSAEIPYPMRKEDTNLRFAPIQRIETSNFSILIGDRNVIVSCNLPYPKWPNFKASILDVMARIAKLGLPEAIERYSVKYVNIIPASNYKEQIAKIAISTKLGDLEIRDEQFTLRVQRIEEEIIHILTISTGAGAKSNGSEVFGVLVDIDSIKNVNIPNFQIFVDNLEDGLEGLKQSNKEKFFGCLTKEAIQEMGPTYE